MMDAKQLKAAAVAREKFENDAMDSVKAEIKLNRERHERRAASPFQKLLKKKGFVNERQVLVSYLESLPDVKKGK